MQMHITYGFERLRIKCGNQFAHGFNLIYLNFVAKKSQPFFTRKLFIVRNNSRQLFRLHVKAIGGQLWMRIGLVSAGANERQLLSGGGVGTEVTWKSQLTDILQTFFIAFLIRSPTNWRPNKLDLIGIAAPMISVSAQSFIHSVNYPAHSIHIFSNGWRQLWDWFSVVKIFN